MKFEHRFKSGNNVLENRLNEIRSMKDDEVEPATDLCLSGKSKLDLEYEASKAIGFDKVDFDLIERLSAH